jgi:hypothetical protein
VLIIHCALPLVRLVAIERLLASIPVASVRLASSVWSTSFSTAMTAGSPTVPTATPAVLRVVFRALPKALWNLQLRHFLLDQLLNFTESELIVGVDQRHTFSIFVCARCPTDAMDIIFFVWWHIIIDHKLNAIDINTATHNVCRYKDWKFLVPKTQHD